MNTATTSYSDLVTTLRAAGKSPAEIRNVSLYLFALDNGAEPFLSKNPLADARRIVTELGLTAGSVGRASFERRLDFDRGIEVVD